MAEDYYVDQYHALNYLTFNVGFCYFATEISQIEQIIILGEVRKLPSVPQFIEGVFESYNRIVIVIDLRKIFQLESTAMEDIKVIICSINDSLIGFIIDDVSQVIQKTRCEIQPSPPPVIRGINPNCVYGMLDEDDKHVLLINLEKILTKQESQILSKVDSVTL